MQLQILDIFLAYSQSFSILILLTGHCMKGRGTTTLPRLICTSDAT